MCSCCRIGTCGIDGGGPYRRSSGYDDRFSVRATRRRRRRPARGGGGGGDDPRKRNWPYMCRATRAREHTCETGTFIMRKLSKRRWLLRRVYNIFLYFARPLFLAEGYFSHFVLLDRLSSRRLNRIIRVFSVLATRPRSDPIAHIKKYTTTDVSYSLFLHCRFRRPLKERKNYVLKIRF